VTIIQELFQDLVQSRLNDLANQIRELYAIGDVEGANLLKQEGLELAEACDNGDIFMHLSDAQSI
jgi:hypothetical protein